MRRTGLIALALLFAAVVGWRVVATSLADRLAVESSTHALVLDPDNAPALLNLAEQRLEKNDLDGARATAMQLLRSEPLAGAAFGVLAKAAEKAGDRTQAESLFAIAVRRAPRNRYARAWLIEDLLSKNSYAEALGQYEILFRVAPSQSAGFFPLFTQLSQLPEFANVLTSELKNRPGWTDQMLAALLDHGGHDAVDRIFGSVQQAHLLSGDATGRWLDRIMRDGWWGEAYSRWVGQLTLVPGRGVPLLYNGGFETEPSGIGFDWRIGPAVGVDIERVASADATGQFAMDVSFSGRRVPEIHFEQRLFLAPGAYKLSFRARATMLRSDRGLRWAIQCQELSEPLAVSAALEGSFAWKTIETPFIVPENTCVAQRIWLQNPGAAGAGKEVAGDIWFDDFAISNESPPAQ